jgi:hypothetical protein
MSIEIMSAAAAAAIDPPEFSPTWFDTASTAWRTNKRRLKGGSFRYTCEFPYTYRTCGRDAYKATPYCRQHEAKLRQQQAKTFQLTQ